MKLSIPFLLFLCCLPSAHAQSVAGSGAVTGFILERLDSGLPDAEVTLSNSTLGLRRMTETTDDGAFDVPGLPPAGGYRLSVVCKGYAEWNSETFEIGVGQSKVFRILMQNDGSRSTDAESLKTPLADQSGFTTWVDPSRTSELPTSSRDLDPLILLAPTVSREAGGRITFQGIANANSVLNDGIAINSGYFGERLAIAGDLTQDSIQELRVLTANYPAEFGRAMGGIVDAVSPPGSNDFHGAAFGYVRNRGYNAANRFAPGEQLLGKQRLAGASLGGPVRHDRIFFFTNLESLTGHFQGVNRITSQTVANAAGNAVATSNCTATAAQCAAAIQFIQSQMNVALPFSEHWTGGLARLDYRRSEVNTFSFAFNARNARSPEEAKRQLVASNGGLLGLRDSTDRTRYPRISWTAAPMQGLVNELRMGLTENRYFEPASQSTLPTSNVAITVAGVTVGSAHPNPTSLNEKRYQLVDNLTITSGTHSLLLGADLSKTRDYLNWLNYAGAYTYPTLTAFAQDFSGGTTRSYTNFTQQFGDAVRRIPYREVALYTQDTWRASPRFDVTVGVRWEKTSFPKVPVANPNYYQTGSIPSPNNDFSPRVSLAYAIGDKTVLRGGFGFLYASYTGQFLDTLLNGNGFSQTFVTLNPNQTAAPLFPKTLTFGTSGLGTSNLVYADAKLRNPRNQQTTLMLERRVARTTTVSASLASSHITQLWTGTDVNLATPVKAATYPVYNASGSVVSSYNMIMWTAKNNSNYAHVYSVDHSGWSWYNAGVLELRHQMQRGLDVQASYTWSHGTGTSTGPMVDGIFPLTSVPGDFEADKGNLPTDQRHRAVLSWTWESRLLRGNSWVARYLVNGWHISGIATLASGLHATRTALLTGNQFSTFTMAYFSSLNGSGGWARIPFEQVGSLSTDAQRNLDARIARTIPFTERIKGSIGFEVLDVFNYQPSTGVNTIAYTAIATLTSPNIGNSPYTGALRPVGGVGAGNASVSYPDGTSARRAQLALKILF